MTATTAAQRKAEERERKREAGLVRVDEWVHRDDAERLRKYAAKLRKARARSEAYRSVDFTGAN
jgi:hypothetical protein